VDGEIEEEEWKERRKGDREREGERERKVERERRKGKSGGLDERVCVP
jgi:hypothetical protein